MENGLSCYYRIQATFLSGKLRRTNFIVKIVSIKVAQIRVIHGNVNVKEMLEMDYYLI